MGVPALLKFVILEQQCKQEKVAFQKRNYVMLLKKKYPTQEDLDKAIQDAQEVEYQRQLSMENTDVFEYPEGLPIKDADDLRNYDLNQLNLRLCDDDLNYLITIKGEDVLVPHIARTLEWVVSSPVEFHLFEEPPIIKSCPGY